MICPGVYDSRDELIFVLTEHHGYGPATIAEVCNRTLGLDPITESDVETIQAALREGAP